MCRLPPAERVPSRRSASSGPRVAAVVSVVETCRRLKSDYLCSILPGLANFPINGNAKLTPSAWAARIYRQNLAMTSTVGLLRRKLLKPFTARSTLFPPKNARLELSGNSAENGEGYRGRGLERKAGSCKKL